MPDEPHPKAAWVSIGKQVLTFIAGIIAASFVLGSARQRVSDLSSWKAEIAPRIERMDSKGTLSFELFHAEYERTQAQQHERLKALENRMSDLWTSERLKELERDTKQIDVLKAKIEALERNKFYPQQQNKNN